MRYNWSIVLLTGIFVSIAFAASAQSSGTIAGTIKQQNGEVLGGATVQLLKADSSLYKTAISDKSGNFEIGYQDALPPILKISMIGYIDHYLSITDSKNTNVTAPIIIQLESLPVSMKAIVVQAKKPLVEMKADRLVVNVDAAPGNAGNNVLEVLEKAPGVAVDKDGNISLKGKQAVLVLIDGRPTYLTPADLSNYLKSLPASAIDQLELMTNPPAKFDAAGNAGVINIKTKKSKTQGFNGTYSGSAGQGKYNRNSNSLQLNYRKNKINLFTNSSYSNWEGFNDLNIERIFKNENNDIKAIFQQFSRERSDQRDNTNLKLGMDYQLNSKTNLGVVVSGFSNPETIAFNNNTQLNNKFNAIDSIVQSTNNLYNKWKNTSGNLYLQHKIDSLGKEITFDLDLSQFGSEGGSLLQNNNYSADNIFQNGNTLRGDFPVDISILSAKTDYTHPLKNNAKLEVGLKSSIVRTNNAANFFNVINGVDQIDFDKTNTFTYRENIN
ncbi:MAG: hypothetical protein RLZZ420_1229, partial [Bacteroidota bacterium]